GRARARGGSRGDPLARGSQLVRRPQRHRASPHRGGPFLAADDPPAGEPPRAPDPARGPAEPAGPRPPGRPAGSPQRDGRGGSPRGHGRGPAGRAARRPRPTRFFRDRWGPFPAVAERRVAYESLQGYPAEARTPLVLRGLRSGDPE